MTHAFSTTPRKKLTEQQMARLFLDAGGKCALCKTSIRAGLWDADHIVSLENGGSNDYSNFQVLCKNCHGGKTRSDRRTASRGRDKAVAHVVPGHYREKSSLSKRPGTRYDWGKRRYVRGE